MGGQLLTPFSYRLQELLAPMFVVFYSKDWTRIGAKASSLYKEIEKITGIGTAYLTGDAPLGQASLAQRMFWLSKRSTTRVEDMAYCVLGIFDINMPLLYGEGPKAFVRLQEEIIKISNDHTIFCWTWLPSTPKDWYVKFSTSLFLKGSVHPPKTPPRYS